MDLKELQKRGLVYLQPTEAEELLDLIQVLFTETKYSERVSCWECEQGIKIIVVKCRNCVCFEYID
jgi:hypothetical protein